MDDKAYKNIHTGKICELERTETMDDAHSSVTTYILSDGSRWDQKLFSECWRRLPDLPDDERPDED
jgi:hypothetical protein